MNDMPLQPDSSDTPDRMERRLARLTPRSPSSQLDRRVAAIFDQPAAPVAIAADLPVAFAAAPSVAPVVVGRVFRVGLALAACLAVGVTIYFATVEQPRQPIGPASPHISATADAASMRVQPVRFDQTITDSVPGEVVIVDDRLPVVPIQQKAIQRTRWVDPHTNSQIELTVPRQQTLIVPVQVD